MKVFADTNFLVSAFASRGLSADVLQIILAEHELILGEFVLDELKRILTTKFQVPEDYVTETEEFLRRFKVVPLPGQRPELSIRDEDDNWVLASAINSKSEVLLTGDKDLLIEADNVKEIKIMNPRSFLELLRSVHR